MYMKNSLKIMIALSFAVVIMLTYSFTKSNTEKQLVNKDISLNEYMVMGVLYEQKAAEFNALCYQAYNIAKLMLDNKLKDKTIKKKKCVIVDIDETVLDNSPFEAKCILEGTSYPKYWKEWVDLGNAKPMPGAVKFLSYALSKGVETFYVTNRTLDGRDITLKNLKAFGFPNVDSLHLITKNDKVSSKEIRRKKIAEKYEIMLLIGDNLADFAAVYDNQTVDKRFAATDSLKNEFGKNFIVIPNPMYGDWENAIYNYNFKLSAQEKDSIRKKNLVSF
jgi:5'-nucleotidase (lipoprotein e(P4) family)